MINIYRIGIIELIHESNTFSEVKTTIESFKNHGEYDECGLLYENELIRIHRGKQTGVGGFIHCCEKFGWEIAPVLAADTVPSGAIDKEAFEIIYDGITSTLKKVAEQRLDGLLVHLHGASAAEHIDDVSGEILNGIRKIIGPETPVISIFDLHANMTDLIIENADICLGYNEEPHTDIYERGVEAGNLMKQMLEGSLVPKTVKIQPPMILPAINMATAYGPMHELFQEVFKAEEIETMINASVFGGFYGGDVYAAGPSIVVTSNNDPVLANRIAAKISSKLWDLRNEFICETTNLKTAVIAAKESSGLTVLIDEADDPAGGAPCDGTVVLKELIDQEVRNAGLSSICDPEIVELSFDAGEGNRVAGYLGGKTDKAHGNPVYIDALVKKLRIDPLPWNEEDGNLQNTGRMALLEINEIYVVITEKKTVTEDIDAFFYFDVDSAELNVIAAKGLGCHIKEVFKKTASEFILVDGVGITHPDVRRFHYKKLRRPCFPFDEIEWSPF